METIHCIDGWLMVAFYDIDHAGIGETMGDNRLWYLFHVMLVFYGIHDIYFYTGNKVSRGS
ncbi:hypothetical protein A3860_13690 [Niastella vici]|uniref:Uncharacterized protein n=1 Tax=Niastella vici TaxID=1703345 RepID=A0A1V9G7H8_9BACT|nr:hypothetical protein A3860_13690 [Niastella vici]